MAIESNQPVDSCINFSHIDPIVMAQCDSWKRYAGHRMVGIIDECGQIISFIANRYDE